MDKKQLKELIEKEKGKGTSVSLIRDKLVAKGYPKEIIDDVLDLKVPGFSVSKIKLLALWCGIFAIIITIFFIFLNVPITKTIPVVTDNKTTINVGCSSSDPDICLFRKAIENNERYLCAQIRNDFLNGLCNGGITADDCAYFELAQYPQSKMSECYVRQAARDNNFTLCIFSGETKNCLDAVYEKNGKNTACGGDAVCTAYFAERTGDYSVCSNVDQCHLANSITFFNPEYCTKISGDITRRNCVSFFARASKEIKYCYLDTNAYNALNCIKAVYTAGSVLSSEDKSKISSLVTKECSKETESSFPDADSCNIKYAFTLQMPFLCEGIVDTKMKDGCNDFLKGSLEVPLSICETFKYPTFQDNCVQIATKCNALDQKKRLECFRAEMG